MSEGREPIRDRRSGHREFSADRRAQRRIIWRGVLRGKGGENLGQGTREEFGRRLTAGDDAGEPTLAGTSGGGWNVFGAAKGAIEPAAEMPHDVEPEVADDPRPADDRLQFAGNGAAL